MYVKTVFVLFFLCLSFCNAENVTDCPLNKIDLGIDIFYTNEIVFEVSKNFDEDYNSLLSILKNISKYEIHFQSINDFVSEYCSSDIISSCRFDILKNDHYPLREFDIYLLRAWENYISKDTQEALQLINDLNNYMINTSKDPWFDIMTALVISSYENTGIIEPDAEGNIYYRHLEKAIKYSDNNSLLLFVIAEAFKYIGYTNPSAHKIAFVEYSRSESLDTSNMKLKKYILDTLVEFYQLYKYYNTEVPEWLKEAIYIKMIQIDPKDHKAYNNLGFLYASSSEATKEKLKKALEYCEKACELLPDELNYQDSLAWAYYINGDAETAIKMYNDILKSSPEHIDSLTHLSSIYLNNSDNENAFVLLKKILEIKPDDASALNNIAYTLAELDKDLSYALECAQKAVSLDNKNDFYIDTLAWVHYKLNNFELALKYQLQTVEQKPKMIIYKKHLAEIYFCMNKYDESEQQLLQILYLKPNDEEALLRLSALRAIMFLEFSKKDEEVQTKYSNDVFVKEMLRIFKGSIKNDNEVKN